ASLLPRPAMATAPSLDLRRLRAFLHRCSRDAWLLGSVQATVQASGNAMGLRGPVRRGAGASGRFEPETHLYRWRELFAEFDLAALPPQGLEERQGIDLHAAKMSKVKTEPCLDNHSSDVVLKPHGKPFTTATV